MGAVRANAKKGLGKLAIRGFVPYRLGIPNARLEIIERAFILGPEIGRLSP